MPHTITHNPNTRVAEAPEVRLSRRIRMAVVDAARDCGRVCELINRAKRAGVSVSDIEAQLGIGLGDLQEHYEACATVAANSAIDVPAWS
jgi:hypothetical protein